MADKRKWTLFIGAVMAVGLASVGCSEEDAVFLPGGDPTTAPADCKNPNTCKDSDECKDGAGLAACKCATEESVCHSDLRCVGIGSCSYTCSKATGTCSYPACASDPACAGTGPGPGPDPQNCDPNKNPDADSDGDGIADGLETRSDPCKVDSDGDTIPDGEEDLNHNGKFEPWLGETDPVEPSDPADANTAAGKDKIAVKKAVCNAEMLNGESEALNNFRVAKLGNGVSYVKPAGGSTLANYTSFEDPANKVAGAFIGMDSKANGKEFLGVAFRNKADLVVGIIEESNFGTTVPNNAWLNNGIYARESKNSEMNKERYQVVADHSIDRYKYHLTLANDAKLTDVRDAITAMVGGGTQATNEIGACANNSAVLYLARSTFTINDKDTYVYSVALACDSDLSSPATQIVLDDVISGTLVAGNVRGTYEPYKDYLCQQELFGEASGSVDFIWIVDNSGSMKDELDNLTQTLAVFIDRLSASGMDYRLGVTTTDAYTIDEWPDSDKGGYGALEADKLAGKSAYLDPVGMINGDGDAGNGVPCMFVKTDNTKVNFKNRILRRTCTTNGMSNFNICGFGFEDGFKSGVEVMRNMAVTADSESEADKNYYKNKLQFACGNSDDSCVNISRCNAKDDALKYLIFVSDEESRQFKESVGVTTAGYQTFYDRINTKSLQICKTGYKLSVTQDAESILDILYNIAMGVPEGLTEATAAAICNPEMKSSDLIEHYAITEDMSPEELKAKANEFKANGDDKVERYYNMLMYYIQQYNKFAGSGGIAAFALVGDVGKEKNGACTELGADAGATEGANYGLSYIHLARYLGALDDEGTFKGKSGGFGSICNTNYETTVNAIFEDVQGRVASHPLRGYPISSTIRVAIAHNGSVTELVRGASKNGWNYDASQNAIVFTGMNEFGADLSEYEVAISYVIWKKNAG